MEILEALVAMHNEGQNGLHGYYFERATEGYNGAVYCVTDVERQKQAVKIARKSARNRAWREFTTTGLLHYLGETISAKPLSLHVDMPELGGDVVISTWLEGENRVNPPDAEDRSAWLAILEALNRVHSVTPSMTKLDLPRAASPAQHPIEHFDLIYQRYNELPDGQLGNITKAEIAKLIEAIKVAIPMYWDDAPPLQLIHSDFHSANILWHENRVYMVDWENAGWADPALDIANMACNWRFAHLPLSHQVWLRGTYAEMRQDLSLPYRAEVYSLQLNMIWLILYSRLLRQRADKPDTPMKDSQEFQEMLQAKYHQRILERLSSGF